MSGSQGIAIQLLRYLEGFFSILCGALIATWLLTDPNKKAHPMIFLSMVLQWFI